MSSDPQIPIWQQFMGHKRRLAKSSLIPLCETLEDTPPNTPYPKHLADTATELTPAITPAAELLLQLSPGAKADGPINLTPTSAPIAELSRLPFPEASINGPIELTPAITPATELLLQLSPDAEADDPTERLPAITPAAELLLQLSPGAEADGPTNPTPAINSVAEPSPQASPEPLSLVQPYQKYKRKQHKSRKKRLGTLFAFCSIITIIAVIFTSQGNGVAGAWMADNLRALVGPTITAQIESWYLGLSNTASQMQYQLGNKQVNTPWKVPKAQHPTPSPIPLSTPPAWSTLSPMPLPAMTPLVYPALAGEGVWSTQDNAPGLYNYLPLDAKAFIRPDPSHPYAIVTLQQFDDRFTLLHIVGGTTEPGGPRGVRGPGIIPADDVQGNTLLAAFNGGFKYADGQYGLMTNGIVYVPPQPNAATIAITTQGKLILGEWGVDPRLNSQNTDLVAWRQNAALLINQGAINPLTQDGRAWGGTILNSVYTWRSAIGITAQNTLIYAAGNALTAETLGEALKAAGAVMAMQTDINPFWVRAFLYNRDNNGPIIASKLNPQMQGTGYEYLYGTQRDFFYLTRFAPEVPPVSSPLLEPTVITSG